MMMQQQEEEGGGGWSTGQLSAAPHHRSVITILSLILLRFGFGGRSDPPSHTLRSVSNED